MITLLLFLISSTLRSNDAQKRKYVVRMRRFQRRIAGSGDEQNKKNIYIFSNSTSLKFSFALCHGILLPPVPEIAVFWATLIYILFFFLQIPNKIIHQHIITENSVIYDYECIKKDIIKCSDSEKFNSKFFKYLSQIHRNEMFSFFLS